MSDEVLGPGHNPADVVLRNQWTFNGKRAFIKVFKCDGFYLSKVEVVPFEEGDGYVVQAKHSNAEEAYFCAKRKLAEHLGLPKALEGFRFVVMLDIENEDSDFMPLHEAYEALRNALNKSGIGYETAEVWPLDTDPDIADAAFSDASVSDSILLTQPPTEGPC